MVEDEAAFLHGKSKRAMEKCGFVFDHIEKDVPCDLMGDVRDECFTVLTRDQWRINERNRLTQDL